MLRDYAIAANLKLQVYPGRPRSINPPTAFVDVLRERLEPTTERSFNRVPSVELLIVWGTFDSADVAEQRDAFVDGFFEWQADRPYAFGSNTLVALTSVDDEPTFTADWIEVQKAYYATRLTLEGFANT